MPEPIYAYPLDQTGSLLSNKILNEEHTLFPVGGIEHHFIIPDFAPFYKNSFILYHPASGHALVEGVDFLFTHYFKDATISTGKLIYGSVTLLNKNFGGLIQLTYQTVGGRWTLDEDDLNAYLNNKLLNPRTTTWEVLTSVPVMFPPTPHAHENDEEIIGLDQVVEVLENIEDAIRDNIGGGAGGSYNYAGLNPGQIDDIVDPKVEIGDDLDHAIYKLQEQLNQPTSGRPQPSYLITVGTTELLNGSYSNGTNGIGATLTNFSLQIALVIDGVTLSVGDTVLVKNQSNEKHNGVYVVSVTGSPGVNWVLTRSPDYDNHIFGMLRTDNFIYVKLGDWNAGSLWVLTSPGTDANNTIDIGTDNIAYMQFGRVNELGNESNSRFPGNVSVANGRFASPGDAQEAKYILRRQITGDIFTELFLDGLSSRLTLPDDSTWMFEIRVSAHQINDVGGHASFKVSGLIFRANGPTTTSLQGAIIKEIISRSHSAWDFNVQADAVNGSLKLEAKGETGKLIRWVASVTAVEVTN